MTMIAYAFLQYRRLKTARRKKKNPRATASANIASRAPSHSRTYRSATKTALPRIAENGSAASSGVSKSAKVVLTLPVLFICKKTRSQRFRIRQRDEVAAGNFLYLLSEPLTRDTLLKFDWEKAVVSSRQNMTFDQR